jgi:hypothetical protein
VKGVDNVAADGGGDIFVVQECLKLKAVESIEAHRRADPDKAPLILNKGSDMALRKTLIDSDVADGENPLWIGRLTGREQAEGEQRKKTVHKPTSDWVDDYKNTLSAFSPSLHGVSLV